MNEKTPRAVVILISGRGSNMRALIERSHDTGAAYHVALVISDQAEAAGLAIARSLGIATHVLEPSQLLDRAAYERALADIINEASPAVLLLAGFMRILSADFVHLFEGRILNIHPSLLPKFPGLHTHRRALEAHEAAHGATVHFVTEQLDGGPPIIQASVAVHACDDELSLATRVQAQEHRLYPLAVKWYCEGRLQFASGQAWLDGAALRQPVQLPRI